MKFHHILKAIYLLGLVSSGVLLFINRNPSIEYYIFVGCYAAFWVFLLLSRTSTILRLLYTLGPFIGLFIIFIQIPGLTWLAITALLVGLFRLIDMYFSILLDYGEYLSVNEKGLYFYKLHLSFDHVSSIQFKNNSTKIVLKDIPILLSQLNFFEKIIARIYLFLHRSKITIGSYHIHTSSKEIYENIDKNYQLYQQQI